MKVIEFENISKQYRLGEVSAKSLSGDLKRWWHKINGKEDPFLKIGDSNDRTSKGNSDLVWALKNINFSINQGEVIGIIGKNGAGKSTLLKILSRVTLPTTGHINIKGRMASLLEVGTGFHPDLTGRENVFLNGAIMGMGKAEIKSKFDEIVSFAGVERYINTPVKRYSSGMYVRLGFAVAAHLEPEILVVDEVLAVGDSEFQKKCIGKMKSVSGEGRTVLFVSHNMGAIQNLCNRAIYLKNGELITSGPTEKIISEYLSHEDKLNDSVVYTENKVLPAQFLSVELLDENGKVSSSFKCGEKLNLRTNLKFHEKNGVFALGVGIANNLDFNVYSDVSDSYEIKNEVLTINYENKNTILAPGKYALTVNLLFNGKTSDYKEKVIHFEVSEITTENLVYNLKPGDGAIVTKGNFKY